MNSSTRRIALIQAMAALNPEDNLSGAVARCREAADAGANIVCLQELYRSRYFCQVEDHAFFSLAETIPGPSTEALATVARECEIVIIAPLFERRGPGVYHNSAVIIDADGKMAGTYRKMHIPDDPGFYEKFYFAPGDLGFRAFDTKFGRVSVLICWDQWYPEAARLAALDGAEILFYPTAIGWHPAEKAEFGAMQRDSWITVQRGHAIANGLYVAAANRVGFEPSPSADLSPQDEGAGIEFWGSSFIAGPQGEILAQASTACEEILMTDVDLSRVETVRRHWPFLRDRRIDAYAGITARFREPGSDLG